MDSTYTDEQPFETNFIRSTQIDLTTKADIHQQHNDLTQYQLLKPNLS